MSELVPGGERVHRDNDDPKRMMALAIYGETGSLATASRHSGIPASTIHRWVQTEEGADTVEALRVASRANSAHKYVALTAMAQDAAMERLVRGDPHVTKDGRVIYTPVKFKDAMVGASIATDKTYLIAGALQDGQKINQALRSLASELVSIVRQGVAEQSSAGVAPPAGELDGMLG